MNDVLMKILRKIRKADHRTLSFLYRQNGLTKEAKAVVAMLCTGGIINIVEYGFLMQAMKKQCLEKSIPLNWL